MFSRRFSRMALAENIDRLTAVRAFQIAHVLDHAQNRHIHHLRHVHGLGDDHGDQLLRGRGDDDAVQLDGLEHGQRHVAGSRGHIDEHHIHVPPVDVLPELLDQPGDHRTAPDHRIGLIFDQQVQGHHLDPAEGLHRIHILFVCFGAFPEPEHFRDGRTGHIRIQQGSFLSRPVHGTGQQGSHHGLADTALAADNTDHLFDVGYFILRNQKALRFCS